VWFTWALFVAGKMDALVEKLIVREKETLDVLVETAGMEERLGVARAKFVLSLSALPYLYPAEWILQDRAIREGIGRKGNSVERCDSDVRVSCFYWALLIAVIRNEAAQGRVRVMENAENGSVFFAHTLGILCSPFLIFRMVIELAEQKVKVQEQEKKMVVLEVQLRLCSLFFIVHLVHYHLQGWRI